MEEKKSSLFVILSYIWIVLPVLIFVIGWCNLPVAIFGSAIILICFYFLVKNAPKLWIPSQKKEFFLIGITFLIALFWVYCAGIGGYTYQNLDHNCRNPIFEMLVNQSWPVESENHFAIMVYYIGFWMVPAVIGKLFHSIDVGFFTQLIWGTIGIFLFFYHVFTTVKEKKLWIVILFILFSGLDDIGWLIYQQMPEVLFEDSIMHLEWWFEIIQYSSPSGQLFWVFNQCIPAWLVTMMLYNEKNNKSMIFIYSYLLISGTLPAIGLLPILMYWMLKNGETDNKVIFSVKNALNSFKSIFTVHNILGGGIIGIISFLYLSNNVSGGMTGYENPAYEYFILVLTYFIPLEVGIYIACIAKYQKNNPLLYIISILFLCFPFFYVGQAADFCMRASIPALVILFLLIVKTFDDGQIRKNRLVYGILLATIIIASATPFHEVNRALKNTCAGETKIKGELSFDNFFGWKEDNTFLKYVGKNK